MGTLVDRKIRGKVVDLQVLLPYAHNAGIMAVMVWLLPKSVIIFDTISKILKLFIIMWRKIPNSLHIVWLS